MAKSEQELTSDLYTIEGKLNRLYQWLFWCHDTSEADDIIADRVRTIRDLNAKKRSIVAQRDELANDTISETIAAVISEMREQ